MAHRPPEDLEPLKDVDPKIQIGIGVIDVKINHIETADEVARAIERAEKRPRRRTRRLGASRLRLLDAQALRRRPQDRRAGRGPRSLSGPRMIRQLTDGPHINHPTYFLQSSFFPGDREMFFTSTAPARRNCSKLSFSRWRNPPTDRGAAIHPFSPALHPDGETGSCSTRGGELWAIDRASLAERRIVAVRRRAARRVLDRRRWRVDDRGLRDKPAALPAASSSAASTEPRRA